MRKLFLPGAWYGAAIPDGVSYAALYRDVRVGTSRGDVALLPGDQPLFLDADILDGLICVAGQSHAGRGLLLHDGRQWRTPDVPAFGESPVCFGLGDEVLSAEPGDVLARYHVRNGTVTHTPGVPLGVDGLRGVAADGTVLRGNNTRADTARVIGEYTELGDVTVGQSAFSCVALHAGKRYVLVEGAQPGGSRAVRFKRRGDQLAIAVHLPDGTATERVRGTLLIWCTVAELALFPLQVLGAPAPPTVPVPHPTPEPKPVSNPLPQNVKDIRDRYVARFPVPQKATPGNADDAFENICRAWVFALAEQVRFETNDPSYGVKNAGGGRPQSKDSLAQNRERLINFDLLSGVGTGRPTLVRDPQGVDITGQQFVPVKPVDHLGAQPVPPSQPPAPPAVDNGAGLAALQKQIDLLSGRLSLFATLVHQLETNLEASDVFAHGTEKRVAALESKPAPTYKATGTTSRDFGHNHRINVTLEPQP